MALSTAHRALLSVAHPHQLSGPSGSSKLGVIATGIGRKRSGGIGLAVRASGDPLGSFGARDLFPGGLRENNFIWRYGSMARLSMPGLLWRGGRELGVSGENGVRPSAVDSKTAETVEGKIDSLVGGGNGGNGSGGGGGDGGGGGEALGWISSALVFAFYGALVYYAAVLAPGQTPYRDQYFIEKLVGLRSGDGFVVNTILTCEFFIMGLWPIIYSSLLLPSGRSQKEGVPTWPFLVLSFGVGAFSLLPYFGLWRPPPPKVRKEELNKFPLNVLENKLVAYGVLLSGVGLLVTAALAGADSWTEMYQYFRESKFIHVMSIDFLTLSTLAPFWVYNDMATRRWLDKGLWLLPLSLVPYVGPALYLVLRPPLPLSMVEDDES